jgi:hypothetical protein
MTEDLFQTSLEALIVEVGIGDNVLEYPWLDLSILATKCLTKSTWKFLRMHNLTLKHDFKTPPQRVGDTPLMHILYEAGIRGADLLAINKCRIFQKIFYLSDMVSGDGTHILHAALHGSLTGTTNGMSWPTQGRPSERDWSIWKRVCSTHLLIRQSSLKHPLGNWTHSPKDHHWLLDPTTDTLYKNNGDHYGIYTKLPNYPPAPEDRHLPTIQPVKQYLQTSYELRSTNTSQYGYAWGQVYKSDPLTRQLKICMTAYSTFHKT